MLSLDQNKLDENLTKAGQKNLQDQYVFLYDDTYFNKKRKKQKTQNTDKKSITIKRQVHKALCNIHLSE